jgi:phage terminase large subunit
METKIQTNIVYSQLVNSNKRISVFQGGTRSGKSYNILVTLIYNLLKRQEPVTLSIVRKTLPAIKGSIMRDFFDILDKMDIYDPNDHNKTENYYTLNNSLIEFVSVDHPQKIRGRKRDILFCNEANELAFEDWQQLLFRTTGKIILDYNPSDEYHWIYDKVLTRDDVDFYKSTYKDNPFLSPELVREIERLKDTDENYWRIYGLGERSVSSASIYSNWSLIDELPSTGEVVYGLDFGFNHPTTLQKVVLLDNDIYTDQIIYKSFLTTDDLIKLMDLMQISKNTPIYCDHARPEVIEELKRVGYNSHNANKSVIDGINSIKSRKWYITKSSEETIKEAKSYKWKETSDGKVLDEPVKFNDDGMDAIRYAVFTHLSNYKPFFFSIA